jgi:hypothetical protein
MKKKQKLRKFLGIPGLVLIAGLTFGACVDAVTEDYFPQAPETEQPETEKPEQDPVTVGTGSQGGAGIDNSRPFGNGDGGTPVYLDDGQGIED